MEGLTGVCILYILLFVGGFVVTFRDDFDPLVVSIGIGCMWGGIIWYGLLLVLHIFEKFVELYLM